MASASGVRFAPTREAALDPALRSLANALPRSKSGLVMIAEAPGPVGIPDLIALPGSGDALNRRLESGIPPTLRQIDAEVIASLKVRQGMTRSALVSRVGRGERAVVESVRGLLRSRAVISDGYLFYRAECLVPVGHIYALEAKVDDWRKGMRQAFRYRAWCSASAVVLSHIPKDRGPLVDAARRLNVGLALEDSWIVRPRIERLGRAQHLLGSEHLVAAIGFSPAKYPQP